MYRAIDSSHSSAEAGGVTLLSFFQTLYGCSPRRFPSTWPKTALQRESTRYLRNLRPRCSSLRRDRPHLGIRRDFEKRVLSVALCFLALCQRAQVFSRVRREFPEKAHSSLNFRVSGSIVYAMWYRTISSPPTSTLCLQKLSSTASSWRVALCL